VTQPAGLHQVFTGGIDGSFTLTKARKQLLAFSWLTWLAMLPGELRHEISQAFATDWPDDCRPWRTGSQVANNEDGWLAALPQHTGYRLYAAGVSLDYQEGLGGQPKDGPPLALSVRPER
jgi:hypothetical protein